MTSHVSMDQLCVRSSSCLTLPKENPRHHHDHSATAMSANPDWPTGLQKVGHCRYAGPRNFSKGDQESVSWNKRPMCLESDFVAKSSWGASRSRQLHKHTFLKQRRGGQFRVTAALIGAESHKSLWAVLMTCGALGKMLEVHTPWGRRITAPLLSLLLGMVLASANVVPTSAPAYDVVWGLAMPLAVALSLLETDVRKAFSHAGDTLWAFWIGAFATIVGTVVAFAVAGAALGENGWKMAACLCASYVGGSINYAATARALGLGAGGILAAGMAADNMLMALYFGAIMALPEKWPWEKSPAKGNGSVDLDATLLQDISPDVPPSVASIATSLAAASLACALGAKLESCMPSALAGVELGAIAVIASALSTIAAMCTGQGSADASKETSTRVNVFAGAEVLGGAMMLLFFTTIGANAGFQEALNAGGKVLFFGFILLSVHVAVTLGVGYLFKLPLNSLIVASNANVGGPATAAAMASARRWPHLIRPALLTGTLGYTIGTAVGCLLGLHVLLPMQAKWYGVAARVLLGGKG
eukprot:TRINITY_DN21064_c0_g1_i1.p1 TRINITY_DN21064_c0_g1~~TRINITY_DN21064_c0_g1_i1.p1  ORF type:complete len:530 (+),score=61.01 TRINITY_DN21064_c0_g1_i1:384-1973(+)